MKKRPKTFCSVWVKTGPSQNCLSAYNLHIQTIPVEISCIYTKLKKLILWENEPLQSISKSAEQTKKDRNFASPPSPCTYFLKLSKRNQWRQPFFFQPKFPVFPCKLYVPLVYYFTEVVTLGATLIWSFTIYDNNNKENVQKDCPTTAWNFQYDVLWRTKTHLRGIVFSLSVRAWKSSIPSWKFARI